MAETMTAFIERLEFADAGAGDGVSVADRCADVLRLYEAGKLGRARTELEAVLVGARWVPDRAWFEDVPLWGGEGARDGRTELAERLVDLGVPDPTPWEVFYRGLPGDVSPEVRRRWQAAASPPATGWRTVDELGELFRGEGGEAAVRELAAAGAGARTRVVFWHRWGV